MAKFEGFSFITSKVTVFLCKVPTTIFANSGKEFLDPGQCPYKSVKTENDIISLNINIF